MATIKAKITKGIGDLVINFRIPILILSLILTIVFCYGITKLEFRVKLADMLPPASPFVKLDQKFGKMFGSFNFFSVQLSTKEGEIFTHENLTLLKKLTDDIYFQADVKRSLVWSLSLNKCKEIRGKGGEFFVNAFMWPHVPETREGLERLKKAILTSDIFGGKLVSKDNKAALITGYVKDDYDTKRFFGDLQGFKNQYEKENDNIEIKMIGRPILMGWIFTHFNEMFFIFGITLALIMTILSVSFRSPQGLLVPLLAGILSTIWGLGMIGLLGINLNPLMVVLPFLMGSRSLSHAVQITSRYIEEYANTTDAKAATRITIESMFLPNVSAIGAEIAGFMTLTLASILLIQDISISMMLWMIGVFFVTAVLTPVICMYMPAMSTKRLEAVLNAQDGDGDLVDNLLKGVTSFAISKSARIFIVVCMGVVIAVGWYVATKVEFGDLTPGTPILWTDSDYNKTADEINKRYEKAGTDKFQLFIEGEEPATILSSEAFKLQMKLDDFFRKEFKETYGGSDTIDPIIKTINKELHEGDCAWNFIPSSPAMIGTCLGFYLDKLNSGDFGSYADKNLQNLNMTFFFKNHMPGTVNAVVDKTREFLSKQDPLPKAKVRMCGGNIGIEYAKNQELERVHWQIIGGVLVIIFGLCVCTFRSITAGLLLIIPLLASNAVALSYMYFKGIGISVANMPVIAVGLGVGVDFGIYLYARYIEEYRLKKDLVSAVYSGNCTAGKGVFFTAVTLIFPVSLWYVLSSIKFQGEMGLFLAILLSMNVVACLVFHPAIATLIKPKFIVQSFGDEEEEKDV